MSEPPPGIASSDSTVQARNGTCQSCGFQHAAPRVWCSRCGVPLRVSCCEPLPSEADERVLQGRADLYRAVLADQDRLMSEQRLAPVLLEPVRRFYDQRLRDAEVEILDLRKRKEFNAIVEHVVSIARAGQVDQARQRLALELKRLPEDKDLKQLWDEIDQRHQKLLADLRSKQQAQELLARANDFIRKKEYVRAIEQLKLAIELRPDDKALQTRLGQAQQLLRDEQERLANEEPVLATIVAPIGTPMTEAPVTAAPVTAAPVTEAPVTEVPLTEVPATAERVVSPADTRSQPSTNAEAAAVTLSEKTSRTAPSFADEEEIPSVAQRRVEALSTWTSLVKPFLMDNVGWFVGAFLVIAGFVVLIVTFWNTIEQNQILMHSLVFASLFMATALFFAAAYFMRLKYPQLESSSDVLLVIVALLIPLVFAAAILTAMIPATQTGVSMVHVGQAVDL
ncbi:MAG: hypothetical protein NXI32_26535 [bacterium]|nr:hypothetical protein [bacterium]